MYTRGNSQIIGPFLLKIALFLARLFVWGNKFWKSGLLDAHFAAGDPRAESPGLKGLAGGFPGFFFEKNISFECCKGKKTGT